VENARFNFAIRNHFNNQNLPSGYHRDLQLLKEGLFPAIQNLKACLDIAIFSIKDIKVKNNILADKKYDYLFTVDSLNEMSSGIPFRVT
jgi:argininosuccinate lyase